MQSYAYVLQARICYMQTYVYVPRLVIVTHGVMFMSRRIVFVRRRVQSVHTSNSERTLANFLHNFGELFSYVRNKI